METNSTAEQLRALNPDWNDNDMSFGVFGALVEGDFDILAKNWYPENVARRMTLKTLWRNHPCNFSAKRRNFKVRYYHKGKEVGPVLVSAPLGIINIKAEIEPALLAAGCELPRTFSKFQLETESDSALVVDLTAVEEGSTLILRFPEDIIPVSSGSWTEHMLLDQLKVKTEECDMDQFFKLFNIPSATDMPLSDAATQLINRLASLTTDYLALYKTTDEAELVKLRDMPEYALLREPIVKYAYLMNKYSTMEAAVDSFVLRLLIALNYEDNMLVAFPQLRLDLKFGNVVKESIADYTVFDVLSFMRMVIMEDKNVREGPRKNSLPQLYGQAVAVHDTNRPKANFGEAPVKSARKGENDQRCRDDELLQDEPLLGVRVNGNFFHFYAIAVSKEIETAMRNCKSASSSTIMHRLGSAEGFNFLVRSDRDVIIRVFDIMQDHLQVLGASSKRQNSM